MTTINDGGPAYPRGQGPHEHGDALQEGMTLRDRFAMQAMLQGAVSFGTEAGSDGDMGSYARWCYAMADAMIEARDEGGYVALAPPEFPVYVDAQGNEHAEF